ncbi:MAG: hypothetical protein NTW86_31160, partial [Candidatus Sumerlaeota bacterium]|nr:hypothetical protein [Candidatus Sumerlaeota bacterium]
MAKQEVIRALGVEQVVVMPGDMAKETWRWVLDDPSENAERARSLGKIAEVWVIPDLQSGASGFTSLCFDDTQRLSEIAASHFMVGFPVNPYHYA